MKVMFLGQGKLPSYLYAIPEVINHLCLQTKLDGLVSKVLDLGYECVLVSGLSYNVILTGIWTKKFR